MIENSPIVTEFLEAAQTPSSFVFYFYLK